MEYTPDSTRVIESLISEINDPNSIVVSFDLFDTLIQRPTFFPTDIFDLVESVLRSKTNDTLISFKRERIEAEKIARKTSSFEEVTLDEIYEVLLERTDAAENYSPLAKNIEISIETQLISARPIGIALYRAAKQAGKTIVLTSDMYLPRDTVIEMLSTCGISSYDKLYLSSETRQTKRTGTAYEKILLDYNINANSVVHFGDNRKSDVDIPRGIGIRAHHIPKNADIFLSFLDNKKLWGENLIKLEPGVRFALGVVCQKFERHIFDLDARHSMFAGSSYLFGYYAVGILVLALTRWIITEAIRDGRTEIFFVARDGKVPLEVFNLISGLYPGKLNGHYLQASRNVGKLLSLKNLDEILENAKTVSINSNLSIREIVEKRLNLRLDGNVAAVLNSAGYSVFDAPPSDYTDFFDVVSFFSKEILKRFQTKKEDIAAYYTNLIKDPAKSVIFDIGYRGRMQSVLSNILNSSLSGYYLLSFDEVSKFYFSEKTPIKNYLRPPVSRDSVKDRYYTAILELVISDIENGSLLDIRSSTDGEYALDFLSNSISSEGMLKVTEIHNGCLEFAANFTNSYSKYFEYVNYFPDSSIKPLESYMKKPAALDANIISDIVFSNGIHEEFKFVDDSGSSYWRPGEIALRREAVKRPGEVALRREAVKSKPLPTRLAISHAKHDKLNNKLFVEGWCLTQQQNYNICLLDETKLVLGMVSKTGIRRNDVFDTYPDYQDKSSGWKAVLSVDDGYRSKSLSAVFLAKNEKMISIKSLVSKIDSKKLPSKLAISHIKRKNNQLIVDGWCLTPHSKFEIELLNAEGVILGRVDRTGFERNDVYENNPQYQDTKSGWQIALNLNPGVSYGQLFAVLKAGSETRVATRSFSLSSGSKSSLKKEAELVKRSQFSESFHRIQNRFEWKENIERFPNAKKVLYVVLRKNKSIDPYGNRLDKLKTQNSQIVSSFVTFGSDDSIENLNFKHELVPQTSNLHTFVPNKVFDEEFIDSFLEKSHTLLKESALAIEKKFDFRWQHAATRAINYYETFGEILSYYRPDLVVIFSPKSFLARGCCAVASDLKIPVVGMEAGVLPGTLMFDVSGHMGESWIAQNSETFVGLPVGDSEINSARNYIKEVSEKNISRRPIVKVGKLKSLGSELKRQGKFVILYVGSNDIDSGHFPYNDKNRENHSPFFENSVIALDELICSVRGWGDVHILAKHHPSMARVPGYFDRTDTEHVTYLDPSDSLQDCLTISDLCVSILSQSVYEALIRKIPVVMLGRNQISGKGCAYELNTLDGLGAAVSDAMKYGFTEDMSQRFEKHVAQLLKYSCYNVNEIGFGRPIETASNDLLSIMLGTGEDHLATETEALRARISSLLAK